MASPPAPFGSLLPLDGAFEAVIAKAMQEGAATPISMPPLGPAAQPTALSLPDQAALRASACLLGKDVQRIATLCNKQAEDVEAMWPSFRRTNSYRMYKAVSHDQRAALAKSLVGRLAHRDGEVDPASPAKLETTRAGELCDLAHQGYIGDVLDVLLETFSQQDILAVLQPLVKVLLSSGAHCNQASEDGDLEVYAAPEVSDEEMGDGTQQRISTAPDQQGAEDAVMETTSVLSPPDSHTTTGGLGTADAAVSLAINSMPLHDKPMENGASSKPDASSSGAATAHVWPHPTAGGSAVPKAEPSMSQEPGMSSQQLVQQSPAFVMGSTAALGDGQSIPPTPVHHRRGSRPSTPQRGSPTESSAVKVCTNCGTSNTPLWRKEGGVTMCNACGIYFKTHGFHRPVDLIRASTSSRRESGGGGSVLGGGGRSSTPTGRGRAAAGATPMSGLAPGSETPVASSDPGASAPGSVVGHQLHGDTATSPPHRRRRSSPSPLRFRNSVSTADGGNSGPLPVVGMEGGIFASDDGEDGLSDGPGYSGNASGSAARRSGRRRTPRHSWQEEEIPGRHRRTNSSGGSVLYPSAPGSSHGKRSRFGEQYHLGAGYYSAPGSEYGDDMDPVGHMELGAVEGGDTNHQDPARRLHQPSQLGREFSFGLDAQMAYTDGGVAHAHDTRQGPFSGSTPRLPSGPVADAVRRAADDAMAAAGNSAGYGPPRRPTVSDVSGSEQQVSLALPGLTQGGNMEVEDTSDLTVEGDPAQVAAVLLGLKHALVIQEDTPPAPPLDTVGGPARSNADSGRNSPWNASPLRGRRGTAGSDRGYWSGPEDTPTGRPTKRSRSPMARVMIAEVGSGSGGGSARGSPAHSGGAVSDGRPPQVCANCGTSKTPLWRKDKETGESMCNACGIYKQTHGYARPFKTVDRDASPSVSAQGAASAPMPVPRGRNKATLSTASGGVGAVVGGTPPGTSSGVATSGSQRRASTGYLAAGRPPLPPPAAPLRSVASGSSAPSPLRSHQSHPASPAEYTGPVPPAIPLPALAPTIPWPGAPVQTQPVMQSWPFYHVQMTPQQPQTGGTIADRANNTIPVPPPGPQSAPAVTQGHTDTSRPTLTSQAINNANRAPQSHPEMRTVTFESLMQPVIGLPARPEPKPQPQQPEEQRGLTAQQSQGTQSSAAGSAVGQSVGANLRPQMSAQSMGTAQGPAIGMPADPNQAFAAAAALAAALQQHQQHLAAQAVRDSNTVPAAAPPAAAVPQAVWAAGAPHPFLTSVYSAQHHLQAQQQQYHQVQQQQQYAQMQQHQQRQVGTRPAMVGAFTTAPGTGQTIIVPASMTAYMAAPAPGVAHGLRPPVVTQNQGPNTS